MAEQFLPPHHHEFILPLHDALELFMTVYTPDDALYPGSAKTCCACTQPSPGIEYSR